VVFDLSAVETRFMIDKVSLDLNADSQETSAQAEHQAAD